MKRGMGSTFVLLACIAALLALGAAVSAFPVNEHVLDGSRAAARDETYWRLQQQSLEAGDPEGNDEMGVPYLSLRVELPEGSEDEPDGLPLPAYLTTGTGEARVGSYCEVQPLGDAQDGRFWFLRLRAMNRKGRMHSRSASLLGMAEGELYLLSEYGGRAAALPKENEDRRCVHLLLNGEDGGLCLLRAAAAEDP